ncbi:FliM/FliN family flagellar motor switch protein [Falsirhodobacter algicola]|uniref:Flagellar motor switch protein FliN-like C-terminal domain-containing protein n=1 Tax=Falsirhodobacter algicola TaxID=2692330 RepID=A0A8J8MSF9_9RHOB|nr:FliM/FliN family flagellar motor switch protein [Falsirhodobacter algicola]QUS35541.1 hypothetical protein GR316_04185 [Falsirhodobacter algicola]
MTVLRKLTARRPEEDGVLRDAVMQAAQALRLDLRIDAAACRDISAEELETGEGDLLIPLRGPTGAGALRLGQDLVAALVELRIKGRCAAQPAPGRTPTRTDVLLASDFIAALLEGMGEGAAHAGDHLDGVPLSAHLGTGRLQLRQVTVSFAGGARSSEVGIALPEGTRAGQEDFAERLSARVLDSDVPLTAVLHRMTLPLSAVLRLERDQVLPLSDAGTDRIGLDAGGRTVGQGQLGQQRGMRAVRLAGG